MIRRRSVFGCLIAAGDPVLTARWRSRRWVGRAVWRLRRAAAWVGPPPALTKFRDHRYL